MWALYSVALATCRRRTWKRHFRRELTFLQTSFPLFHNSFTLSIVSELSGKWILLSTHNYRKKGENIVVACFCPLQIVASGDIIWLSWSYGKEMYHKAWCRCWILVFLIRDLLPFLLHRSCLSSLITKLLLFIT